MDKMVLQGAIDMAMHYLSGKEYLIKKKGRVYCANESLYFKKKGIYYKIYLNTISHIEADDDQTIVHGKGHKFYSFVSLKGLAALLENHGFMLVHRSYLVNLKKVTNLDKVNRILSLKKVSIPYSRRKKERLFEQLEKIK